jgi:hypothetical protein
MLYQKEDIYLDKVREVPGLESLLKVRWYYRVE